jgi:hypothetical protein
MLPVADLIIPVASTTTLMLASTTTWMLESLTGKDTSIADSY